MKKDLTVLKAVIKADYKRHIKKFNQLEPGRDIVFAGDSMVAYFPLSSYGLNDSVYNQGIPGDTTDGLLQRIEQIARLKPKKVILHIGLNDFVLTDNDTIKTISNIKEIISLLKNRMQGIEIIVIGLTPINKSSFSNQMFVKYRNLDDADEVNHQLRLIAGIEFIELFEDLVDSNGELTHAYTKDGIHLNQVGYDLYYKKIKHLFN